MPESRDQEWTRKAHYMSLVMEDLKREYGEGTENIRNRAPD